MKRSAPISLFGIRAARKVDSLKWKELSAASFSLISRVASTAGVEKGKEEENGMARMKSLFEGQTRSLFALPLRGMEWKGTPLIRDLENINTSFG